MAKKLILFSLRLLFVNVVVVLVALFIMMPITSFWANNMLYQWFVTIAFTFLFWAFVWLDASSSGKKDLQKDKVVRKKVETEGYVPVGDEGRNFKQWFGFAGGLVAQSPAILLTLVTIFASEQVRVVLQAVLRGWNITYIQAILAGEAALPYLLLIFPILFAVVSGLGYLNATAQQARLETIIERNKSKKARRVQDEKKFRKNGKSDRRRP